MRDTAFGVFLSQLILSIQVWYKIEVKRKDFSEHHEMQVPITENYLSTMEMMLEKAGHVGIDYPEIPDSDLWLNL